MSFCYIDIAKKFTILSNEFLLNKCRKNRKMKTCNFFFEIWKNVEVQLMSFCYIGIAKKCTSPSNEFLFHRIEWKKCRSPANEFLLHECRQTDRYPERRIYHLSPLDKRYSPIISTICGPKNQDKSVQILF